MAGLGLSDFVIINTDDAVLVCPKERVQDIKTIIADISKRYGEEHL